MKKITDNTIVKVKVPKHLYEAVKARMAELEEKKHSKNEENKEQKKGSTKK